MRIKVAFEIGHSAQLKNKASPEGFTHDWELFVRGADGSNITRFVEKVVFNLHESFPKPCRVYKEPPYVLKESGYASFNLPIDIHLKAGPRDDPKKFSITYDLDISKTTVHKYPLTISNPSSEFRHKLLEGGGIMINTEGHPSDDRTYSQPDSTTAKSRLQNSSAGGGGGASGGGGGGSSGSSKKHKIKSDDIKPTSTFENLFGSPILNSKNSPDPKLSNSSSNNNSKVPITSSGSKIPSQKPPKERSSDKSSKEKREKKDKSGSTPKESSKEVATKKSDEKHERREEKRKEKSTTKDRERSKEKSSKRPPSPKPTSRSPKRSASPPRASSSNSNRHESINSKYDEKTSSSSGKKSKKEKRDKSKERERSTAVATDKTSKETKHQMQQAKQKDEKPSSKSMEKVNGASKKDENESKERDKSNKYRTFDTKPPSPLDAPPPKIPTPTETKKSHDKDERKHKHKKKDKNKEKDRKKSKSKEIPDASPKSTTSNRKHTNAQTPTTQASSRVTNAKTNAMPPSIPHANQLSGKSSSEFEDDDLMDRTSPKPDKVSSSNDTNQSMDHLIEPIPEIVTPRSNQTDSPKKHAEKSSGKKGKEPKSNQSSASKEEKKKKRKTKTEKQKHDDGGTSGKRKIQSPIVGDEPPTKFYKKDDEKIPKIKDDIMLDTTKLLPGRTPPVPHLTASPSTQKLYHQSPDSSKQVNLKRSAESNQSKLAHKSPTITSSSPSSSEDETAPKKIAQQQPQPPPPPPPAPPIQNPSQQSESPGDKQYINQLRALQQKIMTLQDNEELQQVVEMIAATGCYEVTNRTFDFDLCALDRSTVQRLQERLG